MRFVVSLSTMEGKIKVDALLLVLIWTSFVESTPIDSVRATSIFKSLFTDYKKEIAPIANETAIDVSVRLEITDMVPVQTAHMWVDHRLQYSTPINETQGLQLDGGAIDLLWIPNIYFPQGKTGILQSMLRENIMLTIWENGTVQYNQRLGVSSFCPMELRFYPFDIQDCEFLMEIYPYTNEYVKLHWMQNQLKRPKELHVSDYNRVDLVSETKKSSIYDRNILVIRITLYRNFQLYFLRDFFPCILIVMLSWVTFFISFKSTPARIALGITTVLTIVTKTNSIQEKSPPSKSFRSLDYYLLFCMMFVIGALCEYALVGMTNQRTAKQEKQHRKWQAAAAASRASLRSSTQKRKDLVKAKTAEAESLHYNVVPNEEPRTVESVPMATTQIESSSDAEPPAERKPGFCSCLFPSSNAPDGDNNNNYLQVSERQIGPFIFQFGQEHVIDRISKVAFPVAFIIMNTIYFAFHRLHPDTVD